MRFEDLQEVQEQVNSSTIYKTDLEQYNKEEYWEEAGKYGDCEDYAIKKLHLLLKRGWDIKKLRLCICWVGEKAADTGHAVLLAEFNNHLYVLDNRYDGVYEPFSVPWYIWNSCQREGGSKDWVACQALFRRFYPEQT